MKKNSKNNASGSRTRVRHYTSVVLAVAVSFFFVSLTVYSASTISTNISTGGGLTVSGASTLSGAVAAGSTLTVASTLGVTGLTTMAGFISTASSTVSAQLEVDTFGVATSTPSQEVGIIGDAILNSSATTTLIIESSGTGVGGCIQMRGAIAAGGGMYRIYINQGSTTPTLGQPGNGGLVVERGMCQ